MARENGRPPVQLASAETPAVVMTLNQSPLSISGLTVGVVRWAEEGSDAVLFAPAKRAVVGYVIKEKTVVITKPDWTLNPSKTVGKAFQFGVEENKPIKTRVVAFCAT